MNKRWSCIYEVSILLFTSAQLLLRPLALGDVHYRSREFDEFARGAENRMTNAVNVPDGATRMHNAIFKFNVYLLTDGPFGDFPVPHLIVGVNSLKEFFESGQALPRIETQNSVAFVRPVPDIGVRAPGPTARVAELLRLCQVGLTCP